MFRIIERGVLKYVYSLHNLPTKNTIHSKLASFLLAYFRPLPCHTSRLQGHDGILDLAKQGVIIFVTVTTFDQNILEFDLLSPEGSNEAAARGRSGRPRRRGRCREKGSNLADCKHVQQIYREILLVVLVVFGSQILLLCLGGRHVSWPRLGMVLAMAQLCYIATAMSRTRRTVLV